MNFSPQEKRGIFILSFCLALFLGVIYWVNFLSPKSAQVPTDAPLVVQIAGQVENPGVYRVAAGTRVFELIELAGGTKEGAYLESLNLASPLYDGQKVVIPEKKVAPDAAFNSLASTLEVEPQKESSSRININIASASELVALPGIGEVLANRIVEYRTQNGPFRSLEDLKQVRGIGEKKAQELEDYLTF